MTRAILAGIIATIVLSILLVAQAYFGILPEFQLIAEWQALLASFGLPSEPIVAWTLNTLVGAVFYGIVFAALEPILPGSGLAEGLTFGFIAWLVKMLVFMPVAGYGFFGVVLGGTVIAATLGLHLVYGAVLGVSYKLLSEEDNW
jgi:hypothetical protein